MWPSILPAIAELLPLNNANYDCIPKKPGTSTTGYQSRTDDDQRKPPLIVPLAYRSRPAGYLPRFYTTAGPSIDALWLLVFAFNDNLNHHVYFRVDVQGNLVLAGGTQRTFR